MMKKTIVGLLVFCCIMDALGMKLSECPPGYRCVNEQIDFDSHVRMPPSRMMNMMLYYVRLEHTVQVEQWNVHHVKLEHMHLLEDYQSV